MFWQFLYSFNISLRGNLLKFQPCQARFYGWTETRWFSSLQVGSSPSLSIHYCHKEFKFARNITVEIFWCKIKWLSSICHLSSPSLSHWAPTWQWWLTWAPPVFWNACGPFQVSYFRQGNSPKPPIFRMMPFLSFSEFVWTHDGRASWLPSGKAGRSKSKAGHFLTTLNSLWQNHFQ